MSKSCCEPTSRQQGLVASLWIRSAKNDGLAGARFGGRVLQPPFPEVGGGVTSGSPNMIELPPPDLGPTSSLNQTLSLLREVLASHDSSVVPLDARQADFAQVLSCILDPLLQLCTVSASNLGTVDMATYMVNSLYMMKTTLALFEFTDKRLEMLEFQIEAHLDTLINDQASYVLTRKGHTFDALFQGPLANIPSMDGSSLKAAMIATKNATTLKLMVNIPISGNQGYDNNPTFPFK
ncbi:UNVERIFIED_CONTAM: hypothetical protein FKN15_058372 [Acipenser sinensis]